jgi:uncharacterized protein (DUF169 family)
LTINGKEGTMQDINYLEIANYFREEGRLKTFPLGVKFLDNASDFPEKTKRPSRHLGKRVTICQAVSMARLYGWTIGLTREDLICVPAMIAFGFSGAEVADETLGELFCEVGFHQDPAKAKTEIDAMCRFSNSEVDALVLSPLAKGLIDPDSVLLYGNPAQIMRFAQAVVHARGQRIAGNFGGKVECTEYLIAPFKTGSPRIAIPGLGDRIFSMTQDDELILSIPGTMLADFYRSLKEAGKKIGARYPVPSYLNYQPEFPPVYKEMASRLKLF